MRYSEKGLFPALEAALKASDHALDAQALFDMPSIKEHAASVNRVSDYLGNLWRKGLVVRLPAAHDRVDSTSRTRWMYEWKGNRGPRLYDALEYVPSILADRPSMLITELGSAVTIELPNLIVVVRQK